MDVLDVFPCPIRDELNHLFVTVSVSWKIPYPSFRPTFWRGALVCLVTPVSTTRRTNQLTLADKRPTMPGEPLKVPPQIGISFL